MIAASAGRRHGIKMAKQNNSLLIGDMLGICCLRGIVVTEADGTGIDATVGRLRLKVEKTEERLREKFSRKRR